MSVIKCPHCRKLVDLEQEETIPGNVVVGCDGDNGLTLCQDCFLKRDSPDCIAIRKGDNLKEITVEELFEGCT